MADPLDWSEHCGRFFDFSLPRFSETNHLTDRNILAASSAQGHYQFKTASESIRISRPAIKPLRPCCFFVFDYNSPVSAANKSVATIRLKCTPVPEASLLVGVVHHNRMHRTPE
jgi:hypothetical protein